MLSRVDILWNKQSQSNAPCVVLKCSVFSFEVFSSRQEPISLLVFCIQLPLHVCFMQTLATLIVQGEAIDNAADLFTPTDGIQCTQSKTVRSRFESLEQFKRLVTALSHWAKFTDLQISNCPRMFQFAQILLRKTEKTNWTGARGLKVLIYYRRRDPSSSQREQSPLLNEKKLPFSKRYLWSLSTASFTCFYVLQAW